MSKLNILIDLRKAKDVYSELLENKQAGLWCLTAKRTDTGLCGYFYNLYSDSYANSILKELQHDLLFKNSLGSYWYKIIWNFNVKITSVEIAICLQPRLDHLKRTILRIENELKHNE